MADTNQPATNISYNSQFCSYHSQTLQWSRGPQQQSQWTMTGRLFIHTVTIYAHYCTPLTQCELIIIHAILNLMDFVNSIKPHD